MAREPKPSFEITCSLCGVKDTVPFMPRDENTVRCRKCHNNSQQHIPRKKHNTRVSFPITCAQCGKHETLEYRPRVPLTEVLCSTCLKPNVSDESQWAKIKAERTKEAASTQFKVRCDECGKTIVLNNRPPRGQDIFCVDCTYDIEAAGRDALVDTQRLGPSVHIRSKKSES